MGERQGINAQQHFFLAQQSSFRELNGHVQAGRCGPPYRFGREKMQGTAFQYKLGFQTIAQMIFKPLQAFAQLGKACIR